MVGIKYFVEDIWKKASLGYLLIAVAVAVCIRWYFHIPPPSYSVTFMAVAAGLMALRPEMGGREKWLWTLVLFAFAVVEIRAINHDRNESEARQESFIKEQRQHFSDIGDGIKGALDQSDRNFNATMNRTAALLQTETGGDSFCYVTFERSGFQDDYGAVAYHRGGYALRDLTIRIVDIGKLIEVINPPRPVGLFMYDPAASASFQIGSFSPESFDGPLKVFSLTGKQKQDFNIFFSAANGTWYENARLRRVGDQWKRAIRVVRRTRQKQATIFEQVDSGYPLKDGKVQWGY